MERNRIFGGNPLGVLIRLVVLSIIVGIVLSALNIHPRDLVYHVELLVRRVYEIGLPALEPLTRYFVIGAVVVIPIWIVVRLLGLLGGRRDPPR